MSNQMRMIDRFLNFENYRKSECRLSVVPRRNGTKVEVRRTKVMIVFDSTFSFTNNVTRGRELIKGFLEKVPCNSFRGVHNSNAYFRHRLTITPFVVKKYHFFQRTARLFANFSQMPRLGSFINFGEILVKNVF